MNKALMQRRSVLRQSSALALGATGWLSLPAHAAVFLQADEALRLLSPAADQFTQVDLDLSADQLARIAQQSETRLPKAFAPRVWSAQRRGHRIAWVMVDRVIGKYDLIDFAAAFDAQSVNTGVEILAYRESHGGEVRQANWRKQFVGRKGPQAMRFGDDIRNISGATLSCQHVTEGVQRLSALAGLLT
jgi:hypothetical protein